MTTFKDLLSGLHRPPIGAFVKIPSIETLEVLKVAGYDFVVIDGEHAPFSLREMDTMIALARAIELLPMVRVPDHGYGDVQRLLDSGASGIFVPHVTDAADAATVVRQMVHPPRGTRGAGNGMRAGEWLMTDRGQRRYTDPDNVWRVAMIEDREGAAAIEDILATPDLSAVFIGWGDLSMVMGESPTSAAVQEVVDSLFKKAKIAGVPVATTAMSNSALRQLKEQGYDFLMAGNDLSLLAAGARQMLDGVVPQPHP